MSNRNRGTIFVVVGMQYGSEGKGAITSYLAPLVSMGVRTGAANAGHTIYYEGKRFTMQQIPCAWINPLATLVIGVGAFISLPILLREIAMIKEHVPVDGRLFIDRNAFVITDEHIAKESTGDLGARIGSTSSRAREGIGVATAEKVLRSASCRLASDVPELAPYLADTVQMVNMALDRGEYVLLEGTQGFGLSLDHGTFPFVTSRDTSVSALLASVGLSGHAFDVEVVGVARTYPIRVFGRSGSFDDDSKEVSWRTVARSACAPRTLCEQTSVTKLPRRVATWSDKGFMRACVVNRPTTIALTFADYLDWSVHDKEEVTPRIEGFIEHIENRCGIPVSLIQTGPRTTIDMDPYRNKMMRKLRDWS